jgi:hypothetical protein
MMLDRHHRQALHTVLLIKEFRTSDLPGTCSTAKRGCQHPSLQSNKHLAKSETQSRREKKLIIQCSAIVLCALPRRQVLAAPRTFI